MPRSSHRAATTPGLFGAEPAPGFATVAPETPVQGLFTYVVPEELEERARVGVRVRVPFGRRLVRGFIVDRPESCEVDPSRQKPLREVLDPEPVVIPEVLELARWAAAYYDASLGEVLAAAIPAAVGGLPTRRSPRTRVERTAAQPTGRLGKVQRKVLDALASQPLPLAEVRRLGASAAVLKRLEERGLIAFGDEPVGGESTPDVPPPLTTEQQLALTPLLRLVDQEEGGTTLLFGVTGSGKTEVYLRAIDRVLEQGRAAIVLVPEIALTPQTLRRFRARFGNGVAVLHSRLPGADRRREWVRVHTGEARVVIGPRSTIWAPVSDLGLIVVDEEHEGTYKQENAPRYHARDLAVVRGQQQRVPVILGSATPSLESWNNARLGRYRLARLLSRPGASTLPEVVTVDMGREWADVKGAPLLSRRLVTAMEQALARGEQVLLFQNRRGFTTFLQCRACGHVVRCRWCDISLTWHRSEGVGREQSLRGPDSRNHTVGSAVCHFCDYRERPQLGSCPACKGPPLTQRGAGTERIEEVVCKRFPAAAVARLDTDVVRGGSSAEEVLGRFREGEVQVLVGTQIIAKGLDIPAVTVVGVISADTSLALPDFRASERTFQLIAQVAGRAGRGERAGLTVVQSFLPEHFAIKAATQHAFESFAGEELSARSALSYPPYSRLLKVLLRGPSEERVHGAAERLTEVMRQAVEGDSDVAQVLGPAPSPRAYLTGKYRWQLLIKANATGIRRCREVVNDVKRQQGVEVLLDVDPYHLL